MTENNTGPERTCLRAGSISTLGCGAKESATPLGREIMQVPLDSARGLEPVETASPVTLTNFVAVSSSQQDSGL